jgi:hypothetical protein
MSNGNDQVKNPYELNEPPKPEWLDEAIEKYTSKLDFVVLGQKLEAKKQEMDFKYSTQAFTQDWALRKIRSVLDKRGILLEFRVEYIAYGLELFRIWKKFSPLFWKWKQDYLRELKIIAQKWKNRGLDIETLKDIAIVLNAKDIIQFF